MTTLIPNCFNCGRKHGGRYEPKNGVGLLCKKCKDKEIEKALARCAKCNKFIYKKEEAKKVNPIASCGILGFDIWCLNCCEKYEYWTTLKRVKTPREKELENKCWYCKKALDQEAFKKYREIKTLLCKKCREKRLK